MKKVLLIMAFCMPVLIVAQTKKAQSSAIQKKGDKITYEYMEMIAVEITDKVVESPKKSKKSKEAIIPQQNVKKYKISFNFGKKAAGPRTGARSKTASNPLEALAYLGSMGWELTAVSGNSYFLKRRAR